MGRPLRIEYAGAIYHVMNRGDRREAIFRDDSDRQRFLATLGECCAKTDWRVLAYCLMLNHFHLVVETPRGNLVAGMKWFLGTYTGRFNRRHKVVGHLFSGRYKALVVEGSGQGYLRSACDYVHLNPARAKLLAADQWLKDYRWSSYPEYLRPAPERLGWLAAGRYFGELGIRADDGEGREKLRRHLEARRWEEDDPGLARAIRRGWCLGTKAFRQEMVAQAAEIGKGVSPRNPVVGG